ncbi:hypothetical protein [Demequina rhizosphaerae]|uniref:hypothetical protein n=1 Tax=Demequina rhizosphaerae TaxID=1638985 RepID=UPI0012E0C00D|nr:hypothetical protein [Demequina rhizosphaerae]
MIAGVGLAGVAGCSTDSGGTEDLEQQLAEVTAERDALQAQVDATAERYDRAVAAQAAFDAILADDDAYADPDAMIEDLMAYATDTAVMDDLYVGPQSLDDALKYDLFTTSDSRIDPVQSWVDPDGSTSGALWIWHGTNMWGDPFAVVTAAVTTYDDDGLITSIYRTYPYSWPYFHEAVRGAGTPTDVTGQPWE